MTEKQREALRTIADEWAEMTSEEFEKMLDSPVLGDVGNFLLEANAFGNPELDQLRAENKELKDLIINQDTVRGYPTGKEWMQIVEKAKRLTDEKEKE